MTEHECPDRPTAGCACDAGLIGAHSDEKIRRSGSIGPADLQAATRGLLDLLGDPGGRSVLELGSGGGGFLLEVLSAGGPLSPASSCRAPASKRHGSGPPKRAWRIARL